MKKKDLTAKEVKAIAEKAANNPPCPKCGIRNGHRFGCLNYTKGGTIKAQ